MGLSTPPSPAANDAAYILDRLSHVDVLRALPPEEVQAMVPHMELVDVPAGGTVLAEGEAGDSIYLIESGQARVQREGGGELALLNEGDVFGEMALLHDELRSATVVAATPLTLWRLPAEDFQHLVQTSPHLAAALEEVAERRRAGLPLQAPTRRLWLGA